MPESLAVVLICSTVAGLLLAAGLAVAAFRRREGRRRPLVVLAAGALLLGSPGLAVAATPQQAAPSAPAGPAPSASAPSAQAPAAVAEAAAAPEEHTTTVRYGPLPLPPYLAGGDHEHGLGGAAPQHEGHDHGAGHGAGQAVSYAAPTLDMPCRDCYITGVQPDLQYADGSEANHHSGAMLHHLVLFDPAKPDPTCGRDGVGLLTGERIFASGNERTGAHLPAGYGLPIGSLPLGALVELMNMTSEPQQVYVTMTVTWLDGAQARAAGIKEVTPVWLDVDNCGDSQFSIPAGPSRTEWTWPSTLTGDVVAAGGHVHDHGLGITLSNRSTGETICESVAGYGHGTHHDSPVQSMSTCVGDPLAHVQRGDELVLDAGYDSPMPDDTVMGIMLAYLHQTG